MPQKLPSVIVSFVTHVTLESVHSCVNGRMIPQSLFTDKSLFTVLTGKIFAHVNSHVLIISITCTNPFLHMSQKCLYFPVWCWLWRLNPVQDVNFLPHCVHQYIFFVFKFLFSVDSRHFFVIKPTCDRNLQVHITRRNMLEQFSNFSFLLMNCQFCIRGL